MERRECKGYEQFASLYEVSSLGRIRSKDRWVTYSNGQKCFYKGKLLKPMTSKDGYLRVCMYYRRKPKKAYVHKLVALAFLPNHNNYPQVNHKDETRTNNRVYNLEWCTASYNINYGNCNKKMSKAISKSVNQYDKRGKLLHTYKNARVAGEQFPAKTAYSTIAYVCRGERKTAYDYIWKYVDEK